MSPLFIDLYIDEDVDVLVAEVLSAYGFNVLTTREADNLGESDPAQVAFVVREERTFLTHNRADFEALAQQYYDAGREHYGIICAVRRSPHQIARLLLNS